MRPHSYSDSGHDGKRSPYLATSTTRPNHQHPLLPSPDGLVAGAPCYVPRNPTPQDPYGHVESCMTMHDSPSPAGSGYGSSYSSHPQDTSADQFYRQQMLHPSPSHQQTSYAVQATRAPHHSSRASVGYSQPGLQTPAFCRPKSSWIPNLIGPGRERDIDMMEFGLLVRQQPRAARACGFGDRDRRVIDPPPIVQLVIDGPGMRLEERRAYLRYPSYVMNCSIWDDSGKRDASYMPDEYQNQRRLMGSLVSTPFVGDDDRGAEGCFFCFSDLSCRTPGAFRLQFSLMMIDPARASIVKHFPILTETQTEVFYVYSAKEFPGMVASSDLAKKLKEQGCIISIKKGNERARGRGGRSDAEDD